MVHMMDLVKIFVVLNTPLGFNSSSPCDGQVVLAVTQCFAYL